MTANGQVEDAIGVERPTLLSRQALLAREALPQVHVEDLANGEAWVLINQRLLWPTVIQLLHALKG